MFALDHQGSINFVLAVLFAALATVAVLLRLVSNLCTHKSVSADSIWILVALLGLYGYTTSLIWGVVMSGGAPHEDDIQAHPDQSRWFIESQIPLIEFFIFTNTAIKISALSLYRRLFSTKVFLQISRMVLIGVITWWIVIAIQWALICQPLSLFWSPDLVYSLTSDGALSGAAASPLRGSCNSPNALLFVGDMVNILLDHVVLFMPILPIYYLNLPLGQRLGLLALFSVGTFSCVSALVRLIYMFKPHQFYPDFADGQVWSSLHLGTAIIYACVPSYRPLARTITERTKAYFSKQGSSSSSSGNGRSSGFRAGTPLVRENSNGSTLKSPVSPVVEVGMNKDWPKHGWVAPSSPGIGSNGTADWIEKNNA